MEPLKAGGLESPEGLTAAGGAALEEVPSPGRWGGSSPRGPLSGLLGGCVRFLGLP